MANDLNLCQFIGRLGSDPDIRYTKDEKAVANISIACGERWKEKETGEKQEKTEWIRVVAFGKLAEIIGEYLKKGNQVYISGKMATRKWEDKEGITRYTTEIVANQMQMLGSKGDGGKGGEERAENQEQAYSKGKTAPATNDEFVDDDIPF